MSAADEALWAQGERGRANVQPGQGSARPASPPVCPAEIQDSDEAEIVLPGDSHPLADPV
eukprot:14758856-Alexandrium_andersonii.AAC.1